LLISLYVHVGLGLSATLHFVPSSSYKLNISSLPFYCRVMPLDFSSVEGKLSIFNLYHWQQMKNMQLSVLVKISDTILSSTSSCRNFYNHIPLPPPKPRGS